MVASEHTEVIEERRRLIYTEVIDYENSYQDVSIDGDGHAQDEEDKSGSGEAGVSTGVAEVGVKEVEYVQQAVKYSSLSSYIFKNPSLLVK